MKILIADDHSLVRSGLSDVLVSGFPNADVVQASSATEALGIASSNHQLCLAVVDLFMPDMEGFKFLRKLCNDSPSLPVAVVSASDNPKHIRKAIDLGASGYIPKSVTEDEFLSALKNILAGDTYIPQKINNFTSSGMDISDNPDMETAYIKNIPKQLTGRQQEILVLLGEGKSNKHIARELNLSENTVKVHVSAVLKVLDLDNRTQAGVVAQKLIDAGLEG